MTQSIKSYEAAVAFHGHGCPGLALGYRVAEYALQHYRACVHGVNLSACLVPDSTAKGDERSKCTKKSGMQIPGKISPIRAPIPTSSLTGCRETPVKPSFSVPVENTPKYRSVCQNTADLHLTYWRVRPFTSSLFLAPCFSHPDPGNPARTPI